MKLLSILALVGLFLVSQNAFSRDSVQGFSITDALAHEKAQSLLGDQVEFYFGDERPSGVSREFGEFKTNKKTNILNNKFCHQGGSILIFNSVPISFHTLSLLEAFTLKVYSPGGKSR
mgnify:CR=1 FL=1